MVFLTACQPILWDTQLATLPPTVFIPPAAAASTTPSPTLTPAASAGLPETPAPTPTALPAEETRAYRETQALALAQTQIATLAAASPSPTNCSGGPCPTVVPTRTPTPVVPNRYLSIRSPGPQSRVTSPIRLDARAHTGAKGLVRVELLGEDGRLLFREIRKITDGPGIPFDLAMLIDFTIPAVSEAARLQISVDDDFDRPVALASTDLILLSIGDPDLNPGDDGLEPYAVFSPLPNAAVSGGMLKLSGKVRPFNTSPIIAEIITDEGAVVGMKVFGPEYPAGGWNGDFLPYTLEIPFSVTKERGARLVLRQEGGRIPGNVALSSRLLRLIPQAPPGP